MPSSSIGMSATARNGDTPRGTRFFQWPTTPCAIEPATMMAKKLTTARPAVTLKFEVAVEPPCIICTKNDSSGA
ncbi:hypothetical protein D3C84_1265640 [compost metagenome]